MSRFALAAAGTGGHVYPALAVADELVRRGVPRSDVYFFGGDRMEARAVPAAGYELVPLPLQGLVRAVTWRNLRIPGRLLAAVRRTRGEIGRRGTRVLIAFGGYVTVPAVWGAGRIPVFLQEQNAVPGLANRVAARRARQVFHGFPAGAERLPGVVTGNPLRRELVDFDRSTLRPAARDRYGLPPGAAVLGVLGGSLGAHAINQAVAAVAAAWEGRELAILHLAGRAHAEGLARRAAAAGLVWRVIPFEDRMEDFYAAADLVVSRSSALSVSELAATGTPSLLVPRAVTRAKHYELNAAELAGAGAAEVVSEAELADLAARVRALLGDEARLEAMRKAALDRARPEATARIVDALLEAADE